ncbi:MAG TPA: protein kinase [Bryobacteraceae bacterium]|jgi:TonB family protein|nr:protein kinase [Bryobacteraceae bacterium]
MTPVPWKLWEGQVVDLCFPLRRYLGGTDRSAVYLTQIGDEELRDAAIKLVLADTEESDAAVQWDRAAQLSHPNLLPLLRTGRWHMNQLALRYSITEYADENLAGVLAERALTPAEARDLLQPLLGALAYLHSEGLVHGHVKPANILAVGDVLKLTVDGITLVGEPGMAPAEPGPYDPPEFRDRGSSPVGDVWSFGATLVEALTQELPVSNGPKQDPTLPQSIPPEFLPVVRGCLHADARRRATIGEILRQLEHPEPVAVQQAIAHRRSGSLNWMSALMVGASALALAAILARPHVLHRPVASAQTVPVATAPAAPPSAVAVQPEPAQLPKPTPFAPRHAETRAAVTAPAPAPIVTQRAVESAPVEGVHQVLPEVPDYARRTIRGKVKIQVRASVNADGRVTGAKVESQNSRYFAKLALEATRQWNFAAGPGDWLVRYEFTPAGTAVHPSRVR